MAGAMDDTMARESLKRKICPALIVHGAVSLPSVLHGDDALDQPAHDETPGVKTVLYRRGCEDRLGRVKTVLARSRFK